MTSIAKDGIAGRMASASRHMVALTRLQRALGASFASEFARRANSAVELARTLLDAEESFEYGEPHAEAAELYRHAVYWALRARSPNEASSPQADFTALWQSADRSLLERAAGSSEKLAALEPALFEGSFVERAERDTSEQRAESLRLRRFAEALVDGLDPEELKLARRRARQRAALLVGALGLIGLAVAALFYADADERRRDLAVGKAWSASSRYPEGGCVSPEQHCRDGDAFFFSTNEEMDPWLIIDLGHEEKFSAVRVHNRRDCCSQRAIPLIVEVSDDKEHWQEVTRREAEFTNWKGHFAETKARYVRFHVPRRTNLHFEGVSILR